MTSPNRIRKGIAVAFSIATIFLVSGLIGPSLIRAQTDGETQQAAPVPTATHNDEHSSESQTPPGALPGLNALKKQLDGLGVSLDTLESELLAKSEEAVALATKLSEQTATLSELENALTAARAEAAAAAEASAVALRQKDDLIEELKERASGSSSSIVALQGDLAAARAEIDRLNGELQKRGNSAESVAALHAELSSQKADNDVLVDSLSGLEKALEDQKAATAASQNVLAKVEAERDALKLQRFWLSILVAILLATAGFLGLRRRNTA